MPLGSWRDANYDPCELDDWEMSSGSPIETAEQLDKFTGPIDRSRTVPVSEMPNALERADDLFKEWANK